MKTYDTVSEATTDLKKRGYSLDFNILTEGECIACNTKNLQLKPEEFHIDEVHRFEGNTDPGDEMIVYAISSLDNSYKGVLVNAYGLYSDADTYNIIKKLRIE